MLNRLNSHVNDGKNEIQYTHIFFLLSLRNANIHATHREHSIFQDGGAPSDSRPLEGILSFGKGVKQVDPFESGDSYEDE